MPQDHIKTPENWVIDLEQATYIENYVLELRFSDGLKRKIDFGPFLHNSSNPLIKPYLEVAKFKEFTVEHGDLQWNDYDLCFPIIDLYEGNI